VLKAVNNFDETFGVKFSTYTVPMIVGEIKRFMRDNGAIKVSRNLKILANKISKFIDDLDLRIQYVDGKQHTILDGEDVSDRIREPHVSMAASNVSSLKCVRLKMVEMQRKIASEMSCVLDGRDIGSYVLPNADFKFYITASVKERTDRRYAELKGKGFDVNYDELMKEIEQRDYNDSHRDFAPLRQAEDAIYLDTSDMSIEEVVAKVLSYVK
jgi:cytidylate kinase